MFSANRLRIVPSAALAGLVAPITSRHFSMAFSRSSANTTTGPSVMNLTKPGKKAAFLMNRVERFRFLPC